MITETAPASAAYEVATQREMIAMARKNLALECALLDARAHLDAVLPGLEEWRQANVRAVMARIDRALNRKEND